MREQHPVAARVGVALAALITLGGATIGAQPQRPPAIRTGITIVPIDVRAVDRNGKAVTDLVQEDFTVLEDGVPQAIRHFSTRAFTADASAILREPEFRRAEASDTPAARNRRVFLIMLGRGRHRDVSNYVSALERFVGERLLPQDQVALIAWNRATDFTTDHQVIRRTIARYRDRHPSIEMNLKEWFSGLRAIYGSAEIPRHIQQEIDAVFEQAVALRPRELTPGQIASVRRVEEANARAAADRLQDELARMAEDGSRFGLTAPKGNPIVDTPLNELIARSAQLRHDLGNVYTGIDYLRYLEGEKHLVLLTEQGMSLPHLDMNTRLARVASDARVALDIIQTGGMAGPPPPQINPITGGIVMQSQVSARAVFDQGFAVQDLRMIAKVTGGQLHAFRQADDAFRRLEEGMRVQYLLGYAPANANPDGTFRTVTIKVNRPGVEVMHRQGYFATTQFVPLDRRQFVTVSRIHAAGQYSGAVDHIKVRLGTPAVTAAGESRSISIDVTVDISRLKFSHEDGRYVAALDVALFCGDAAQRVVCEAWRRVDLKLTEELRQQMLAKGTAFRLSAPVTADLRAVKVVVYDYAADLVGTAVASVR